MPRLLQLAKRELLVEIGRGGFAAKEVCKGRPQRETLQIDEGKPEQLHRRAEEGGHPLEDDRFFLGSVGWPRLTDIKEERLPFFAKALERLRVDAGRQLNAVRKLVG